MFREQSRDWFSTGGALPRFLAALAEEDDEVLRDFFTITLFTEARKGNVQSMRWADVNLDSATWMIPAKAFKTRRPMHVVLSLEALEISKRRTKSAKAEFVFPSHGKTRHLIEPKAFWERLRKRSGLADLRPAANARKLASGGRFVYANEHDSNLRSPRPRCRSRIRGQRDGGDRGGQRSEGR